MPRQSEEDLAGPVPPRTPIQLLSDRLDILEQRADALGEVVHTTVERLDTAVEDLNATVEDLNALRHLVAACAKSLNVPSGVVARGLGGGQRT